MNGAFTRAIEEAIGQVADTNETVLIRGERGVGKDFVARAIHSASPRKSQPFIKVNCAAVPQDQLESVLLGQEKGAFSGADRRKLGAFEFANKGSIFLEEIADLPRPVQAELLHVLQYSEFSRIGGGEKIQVDVRIIASTRPTVGSTVQRGEFWEDFYRLNVVDIPIPPLRARTEEIPGLASLFLARFNEQYQRNAELLPETTALFTEYSWPGNIRELEAVVRRLVVTGNSAQIHEEIHSRLVKPRLHTA